MSAETFQERLSTKNVLFGILFFANTYVLFYLYLSLQFSDILLYTSRSQATLQFKVHGHMPLRGVLIEEPEGELQSYGLVIYGGNRALTVAANSQEEKDRWKQDLQNAIQQARDKTDTKITYLSLKSCSEYTSCFCNFEKLLSYRLFG